MPSRRLLVPLLLLVLTVAVTACGSSDDAQTPSGKQLACVPSELDTIAGNALTVGTSQPAEAPYFVDGAPQNGEGFESAVTYAIAQQLGLEAGQVKWVPVPIDDALASGEKKFDFDINEIAITSQRQQSVDFSTPYYTGADRPWGVVMVKGSNLKACVDQAIGKLQASGELQRITDQWLGSAKAPTSN